MSILQRGHLRIDSSAKVASIAAPQCGQCLLPMNIMPKHEGHATVASFDSQYWHCGASDDMAAPQLGQFRLCAFIAFARANALNQLNILRKSVTERSLKNERNRSLDERYRSGSVRVRR